MPNAEDYPEVAPEIRSTISDEYGPQSSRILDALDNARAVLAQGSFLPLQAMTFAYSVRTAADALFDRSGFPIAYTTRESVDRLSEAMELFDSQRGLGGSVEELFGAIRPRIDAVIESRNSASRAEQAYHYVFARRMGAVGPALVGKIKDLLSLRERAASALHSEMSMSEAQKIWVEFMELITSLFSSPAERVRALDDLAALEHPSVTDMAEVEIHALTPAHTRQFLRSLSSVEWLDVIAQSNWLTSEMIKTWGAMGDIFYSFQQEPEAVTKFAARVLEGLDTTDIDLCAAVAIASMDSGDHAARIILPLLRQSPGAIARIALRWATTLASRSEFVSDVADVVLNEGVLERAWGVSALLTLMLEGVDAENAASRLQCLEWKLRRVPDGTFYRLFYFEVGNSILERHRASGNSVPEEILDCYAHTMLAVEPFLGSASVLSSISRLPAGISSRLRVAFATRSRSLEPSSKAAILAEHICADRPNVDGLALLDGLVAQIGAADLNEQLERLIGPPPALDDIEQQAVVHDLEHSHWYLNRWVRVLPQGALPTWHQAFEALARDAPPRDRDYWQTPSRVVSRTAVSPLSEAYLAAGDVLEVCRVLREWRASPDDWPSGPSDVGHVLEKVVAADPSRWKVPSLTVIFDALRHPTYVAAVIDGFRSADSSWVLSPDEIVEICDYVWSRQGQVPEQIGARGDWDYVKDWERVRAPAVDLIEHYANRSDFSLAPVIESLWPFVRDSAEEWELGDRPRASGDALHRAMHRYSTRALLAVLALMGAEHRSVGECSLSGTEILSKTLDLAGADGSEYRSLIAVQHDFIRSVAPSWWEAASAVLLNDGSEPARDAFDMLLAWSTPSREIFEDYVELVKDAVDRDAERAAEQMITACLRLVPGYSVATVAGRLLNSPGHDQMGEHIAWVVEPLDTLTDAIITQILALWSFAVEQADIDDLANFGRLCLLTSLPDSQWLECTRRTLEKTDGRLAYASDVAERVERLHPDETTLSILDMLIRTTRPSADYWGVDRLAIAHLSRASELQDSAAYRSLRIALLERGFQTVDQPPA